MKTIEPPKNPDAVRPPVNKTDEHLLDEALTLFANKGYEASSVRDIIEKTGVTRPMLYYYCKDKEDLFRRLLIWKHDEAHKEIVRQVGEKKSLTDKLRVVVRGSFLFCAKDPRVTRVIYQTIYGPPIDKISDFIKDIWNARLSLLTEIMKKGLEDEELTGGDAASLAMIFLCIIDQHINIYDRLPNPEKRLSLELADNLVEAFLHGAGTGKRRKYALPPFAGK